MPAPKQVRIDEDLYQAADRYKQSKRLRSITTAVNQLLEIGCRAEGLIKEEVTTMTRLSPAEAWEGFVGSQTPEEFMEASRAQGHTTVEAAVAAYVKELPALFDGWDPATDLDAVADILAQYIRQHVSE